jgi:magnesium transporter
MMIKYFFSAAERLQEIMSPHPGCWISMIDPSEHEIQSVAELCDVDRDALTSALDTDERSRIETGDCYTMVLTNIPTIEEDGEDELYTTLPLSIITSSDYVITVCLKDTPILKPFSEGRMRDFYTGMKSRFILQVLYQEASHYLQYLHIIDKKSDQVEDQLHKSTQNSELITLLGLEKSLVYFSTALRSNEVVLERLLRTGAMKQYPEDSELLEDVIVENKQAIEMANIYSGILSGMMDAFASVISNNLNIVMKVLAILTIILSIPTMIFSAFGMNMASVGIPLASNPYGFIAIVGVSMLLSLLVALIFMKMKMFK